VGSIPLGLAPLVHNATGLYVSRFFIGILGGSFVPCQVWSTGFFDKNIVGTANALTGGFGNAGGGITYFIMPAVYDALIGARHTPGQAWRLTFLVPLAMVITTGIALIALCPDTPTGKWRDRHLHVRSHHAESPTSETDADTEIVDVPGRITDRHTPETPLTLSPSPSREKIPAIPIKFDLEAAAVTTKLPQPPTTKTKANTNTNTNKQQDRAAPKTETDTKKETILLQQTETETEVIRPPNWHDSLLVACSPQTIFHMLTYMCSFGTELALNSVLASYYAKNFPGTLGQTAAANWAAMFGFLNFVTRPVGGAVSDLLYARWPHSAWSKKAWILACGFVSGALLVVIGQVDPRGGEGQQKGLMFGLVAVLAFFVEAGNGANFSLVPHVHPHANGIVSGLTGAGGNLGGVLFAVVFRFMEGGTDYAKGFWVIGVVNLVVCAAVSWIPPLPTSKVRVRSH
jgi:NNP family nitrate/nitrite transporter-like MFS transporter